MSPLARVTSPKIESGARPHLTNTSRQLLARFFKVHPGYLVDDPEGYHAELLSDARLHEDRLDSWLVGGAERFRRRDPALCHALLALAKHDDSRQCLLLLESILGTPQLADRLLTLLRPQDAFADSVERKPDAASSSSSPSSARGDSHLTSAGGLK